MRAEATVFQCCCRDRGGQGRGREGGWEGAGVHCVGVEVVGMERQAAAAGVLGAQRPAEPPPAATSRHSDMERRI